LYELLHVYPTLKKDIKKHILLESQFSIFFISKNFIGKFLGPKPIKSNSSQYATTFFSSRLSLRPIASTLFFASLVLISYAPRPRSSAGMATPGQSVTGRGTRPWMQQPRIKSGE
jgi:hypothetical protein